MVVGVLFWWIPTHQVTAKALSKTVYVPDGYPSIQSAVDATNPDDIIVVRDGIYIENIDIDKRLTIESENGADSTIVQAASANDHVFEVTQDYVNIIGFTIQGAVGEYPDWKFGIHLDHARYCTIADNVLSNNYDGIRVSSSSHNVLTDNVAENSYDNGISIQNSSNNSVQYNVLSNNSGGVLLFRSSYNEITYNSILSNNPSGIYLSYDSAGNSIHTNSFSDNAENVGFYDAGANYWNSTSMIVYTYHGTTYVSYLGNYWDDYTGSDADEDGIGDIPYSIGSDSDDYPLIKPIDNYEIGPSPTPTPIPTPTPTVTPTPTSTPTATPNVTVIPTAAPTLTPTPTPVPSPPINNEWIIRGIAGAVAFGVIVSGLLWANRNIGRRRAANARIRRFKRQLERWRQEGYDVSDLEDLFK